jgi:hypothetical protein
MDSCCKTVSLICDNKQETQYIRAGLIVATGDCAPPFDGDLICVVIEVSGGHFCNHWPWFQKV